MRDYRWWRKQKRRVQKKYILFLGRYFSPKKAKEWYKNWLSGGVKKMLKIKPLTLKQASEFIENHHRHNGKTAGCKFAIGCFDEDKLVGVSVCGRPISRYYDDGTTLEINRVCTDGTYNACSMLYGASCRIAKEMGYKKVITYTLETENGASLKASNFKYDGEAGGGGMDGSTKFKKQALSTVDTIPRKRKTTSDEE